MKSPAIRPSRRFCGITLLETTIVILIILSLVAILFVGTRGWRRGADRSACMLNIRNAQAAVRAYQNTRGVAEGSFLDMSAEIIGPGKYLAANPSCPGGGNYLHISHVPFIGELAISCSLSGSEDHHPDNAGGW